MSNQLNTLSRIEIAEALAAAKPFLYDGRIWEVHQHKHICHAIDAADEKGKRGAYEAKMMIQSRLVADGVQFASLDGWVTRKGLNKNTIAPNYQMQAFRHRWLDALIEEFSNPAVETPSGA